jgi:hypothetical protein
VTEELRLRVEKTLDGRKKAQKSQKLCNGERHCARQ